jgi:aminopeptidase-like protein
MARAPQPDEPALLEAYFDRLWPLLRSITGAGLRQTLDIERLEIPSGTAVFDWTVPPEWVVRAAYVVGPDGRRRFDVAQSNLRLVNYAAPFRGRIDRAELDRHLFSLPDQPDAIPYVTRYYTREWGFCVTHREREALPDGDYEAVVDTDFVDGAISLAEAVLPGRSDREVLFTSYVCHPSLANNELSGPLVLAMLYRRIAAWPERDLTYRFVLHPETIGALSYLSRRRDHLRQHVVAGYVVTCVGDAGPFTYKRTRREGSLADRAARLALRDLGQPWTEVAFNPADGSDERQYCSPGIDLPIGSLMRTMYGRYPQYHSSADDKSLMSFSAMAESVAAYEAIARTLEANRRYHTCLTGGEPQLGRRGLYGYDGVYVAETVARLLWVLH